MKNPACVFAVFLVLLSVAFAGNGPDLDLVRINIINSDQVKQIDLLGVIINQVHKDYVVAEISKAQYLVWQARAFILNSFRKTLLQSICGTALPNHLSAVI